MGSSVASVTAPHARRPAPARRSRAPGGRSAARSPRTVPRPHRGGGPADAGAEVVLRGELRRGVRRAALHDDGDLSANGAAPTELAGQLRQRAVPRFLVELGQLARHAGAPLAQRAGRVLQGLDKPVWRLEPDQRLRWFAQRSRKRRRRRRGPAGSPGRRGAGAARDGEPPPSRGPARNENPRSAASPAARPIRRRHPASVAIATVRRAQPLQQLPDARLLAGVSRKCARPKTGAGGELPGDAGVLAETAVASARPPAARRKSQVADRRADDQKFPGFRGFRHGDGK